MLFFDEKRYKNGPETESHIMIILRSIQYYCCPINSIKYKNSTARALCIQWSSFILSIQAPSKYGQLTILFLISIYV